ncbi:hypothetical protein V6N13_057813 [Hibiscus sabdariffa]
MEVSLTGGAVARIINGEVSASSDSKPVLQVIELEEIQTTSQQQQEPRKRERRFVLSLSDGLLSQQCLLAASKNRLVKSSKLQIGSIVRLTQFVRNFIQDRMMVIIIELEVMVGKCDIIGKPVPAPKSSRLEQAHTGSHNPGSVACSPLSQSVPAYQQPSPSYINREPLAKNEIAPVIPISALNPCQGRWTIKARVTKKQELKHYRNAHGEGKVFSFDLIDSDGGEIRATCFNAVVDQFYNQIQAGNIYLISRGSLKPAQKEFNHLNSDHQIFLDNRSMVQMCSEDKTIPWQQFHFRTISDVEGMKNNDVVDIIGVVFSIGPTASLICKNDAEILKRSLHLKDMSGRSVELTLWGAFCNSEGQKLQTLCDSGEFPILAVKSGRVSDFSGKEVGTISSTQLFINPDFPEAHKLRKWFAGEGRSTSSVSIAREKSSLSRTCNRKTISQIKDEGLGTSEKPDWITVVATVAYIKLDNFCYTACSLMDGDLQCNKKVTNNGDGKWRCDKCDRLVDECDYRYILQFLIQDHTGIMWVIAFQESGEGLMGVSAKDLYCLRYENQNVEKFKEIMHRIMFTKYAFKLKVKEETFNEERRVKSTVVEVENIKFPSESRYLLSLVDKIKANNAATTTPNLGMDYYGIGADGMSIAGGHRVRENVSNLNVFCNGFNVVGHSSTNCSTIMNGSGESMGRDYTDRISSGASAGRTADECYKCHQFGHWAKDCPRASQSYRSSGFSSRRYGGVSRGMPSKDGKLGDFKKGAFSVAGKTGVPAIPMTSTGR